LVIAGREFQSRLLAGTGKFSSPETMREALAASLVKHHQDRPLQL
jgi:thiazole synthase ThiGH ThiG subunit